MQTLPLLLGAPGSTGREGVALMADVFFFSSYLQGPAVGTVCWDSGPEAACQRELDSPWLKQDVFSQLGTHLGCLIPICRKLS